MIQSEKVLRT